MLNKNYIEVFSFASTHFLLINPIRVGKSEKNWRRIKIPALLISYITAMLNSVRSAIAITISTVRGRSGYLLVMYILCENYERNLNTNSKYSNIINTMTTYVSCFFSTKHLCFTYVKKPSEDFVSNYLRRRITIFFSFWAPLPHHFIVHASPPSVGVSNTYRAYHRIGVSCFINDEKTCLVTLSYVSRRQPRVFDTERSRIKKRARFRPYRFWGRPPPPIRATRHPNGMTARSQSSIHWRRAERVGTTRVQRVGTARAQQVGTNEMSRRRTYGSNWLWRADVKYNNNPFPARVCVRVCACVCVCLAKLLKP